MTNFKSFVDKQTKRIYYNQDFKCPECSFNFSIVNSTMITPKLTQTVYGIGSRTRNGLHVLFTDYDEKEKMSLSDISNELKRVQKTYSLSHWFIFKRPGTRSYHAICPTIQTINKTVEVLQELSIDFAFIKAPKYYQGKQWILGVTDKGERKAPVFVRLIKACGKNNETKPVSRAHITFLENYYKVPKLNYVNKDKFKTIPLIKYKTGNRVR